VQCKVGLGVQHTGRVQSARPAARVNNSTCAGKSHTRTAAVLQQAACVNADGQIYCKTFLGGPILTENEGKIQSTRLQIHPMIKIWQSILFCLSHRRFPSLCRSLSALSNRSFFLCALCPWQPGIIHLSSTTTGSGWRTRLQLCHCRRQAAGVYEEVTYMA